MSEESQPSIRPREHGPLLVTGNYKFVGIDGVEKDSEGTIALCRCGDSQNKPFCDGTHRSNGFTEARENAAPLDKERVYEGAEIRVHDNRVICCHAAICVQTLPKAFEVGRSPWIDPDGATRDELIEVTHRCPSGALAYETDGVVVRTTDRPARVRIIKDGPIAVEGGISFQVEDSLQPPSSERFTLCRCGHSKNKPYCDGAHKRVGFRDDPAGG